LGKKYGKEEEKGGSANEGKGRKMKDKCKLGSKMVKCVPKEGKIVKNSAPRAVTITGGVKM
jgi:hypothetical protein